VLGCLRIRVLGGFTTEGTEGGGKGLDVCGVSVPSVVWCVAGVAWCVECVCGVRVAWCVPGSRWRVAGRNE
jgi:hypothetical protein